MKWAAMPGDQSAIERALHLLGERLEFAGAPLTVLLVGGGAGLNLLGLVLRTTKDVDVIALVLGTSEASNPVLAKADPLPSYLAEASALVARDLSLPRDWLNPGPTSILDLGLPDGCLRRCVERTYGSRLRLLILSRFDQIHLKLYAAVDQGGGRHLTDLRALRPTSDELSAAARWTKTHDASPGFNQELVHLLTQMGYGDVARRL
jgi:hypothetical protein